MKRLAMVFFGFQASQMLAEATPDGVLLAQLHEEESRDNMWRDTAGQQKRSKRSVGVGRRTTIGIFLHGVQHVAD